MKKILTKLCYVLLCLLCVCLVACGNTHDLYQKGIEITTLMQEMLYSDQYQSIMGYNDIGIYNFDYVKAKDYDTPTRMYKLTEPTFEAFFDLTNLDDEKKTQFMELPDELKDQIKKRIGFNTIFSVINQQDNDFEIYLISSAIIANKTYYGNLPQTVAYLYTFETGKPIAVVFKQTGNNQFTASGYFVFAEGLTSLSGVREVFEPYGCTVEVLEQ